MQASNRRLVLSSAIGGAVGVGASFVTLWQVATLLGWCAAATSFLTLVGFAVARLDAQSTEEHATAEAPSILAADVTLLIASIASLIGVGFVLAKAGELSGTSKGLTAALGALSVMLAWMTLQTIFTLRYARMYYDANSGGIDFGGDKPDYGDFAYLAFTVGMTYQVSDTAITGRAIRRVVLRHALLSFVFATAFIAVLINVVGGLL